MSLAPGAGFLSTVGVPRASGDEPRKSIVLKVLMLCSPRERG